MGSEQQYIELYEQAREMIIKHAPESMNVVRDQAFEDFKAQGFPSKKVERYKYTDVQKLFEPDFGVNINRLQIPVDPYEAFHCDVPNLSTSLYFVVNDMFYHDEKPKGHLPEGVVIGSCAIILSWLANTTPSWLRPAKMLSQRLTPCWHRMVCWYMCLRT